ncbi:MAG TPA: glycosyltransferase family 1 protein [Anaerolineae bacterium]|nr:glycosyltransferase family 1 protein [Anaerolineae bacterium]
MMTHHKIGLDATALLGLRSGIGHYTARLINSLMTQYPHWQYLLFSKLPLTNLERQLQHAHRIPGHFAPSHWVWLQTMLPYLLHRYRPHICHFTNEIAPLWSPIPYIITLHDASLFLYSQYHPRSRLWTRQKLLPLSAKRAQAIITVSESSRQDLIRVLNIPPHKIHVTPEAAPTSFKPITDKTKRAHLRQKYHLPEKFILYVGTIEPRKNLHRLVSALAQLHQHGHPLHLVLAGPSGWLMNDFNQHIANQGLTSYVHHLGYLPTAELPTLFSLATIFAYVSLYEGFGLPVLEAMACGTPVLTSNQGALAEIAANAAHTVNPLQVDDIAAALRQIVTDPAYQRDLSQRGQKRAALFSWGKTAQKTAEIYQNVLNL